MAMEGEEEQQRWETSLQARTEQKAALYTIKKNKQKHARLTKASLKSEVGKGQREIEVLKLGRAVQVQRLRSAGSGKGMPEDDKV
jgi:hypothetical protein